MQSVNKLITCKTIIYSISYIRSSVHCVILTTDFIAGYLCATPAEYEKLKIILKTDIILTFIIM